MFTTHFAMKAQPFADHCRHDAILKSERVAQTLAKLAFFLDRGALAVLTGSTGTGKSTLLRHFLDTLPKNKVNALYLHLTALKPASFLALIVHAMGEVPKRGKDKLFLQILGKASVASVPTLLVIDEAQELLPDALVDLKLLISSALDDKPPLKIILAGQDGLLKLLRQDRHADMANRAAVRSRLFPFSPEESVRYIDHQLSAAGASPKIFDDDVKRSIHDVASGVPMRINSIATACLLHAAAENQQKITADLFQAILDDISPL